jgi:SAM-dependent methyltransferase
MKKPLKLNLGCGYRKMDGYVNIDNRIEVNPDSLWDLSLGLSWPISSVDEIRAFDILEHIPIGKTMILIESIWRSLKPGGIFEHFTPSTDGRGAFQDPFHVSFWNINSWLYYTDDAHRNLYGTKAKFEIEFLNDVQTGPGIIHTHGRMKAVK